MVKTISKESKDLAIEFADFLLRQDIKRYTSNDNLTVYRPIEFILMSCELIKNSKVLFNKFLEEKYNENS